MISHNIQNDGMHAWAVRAQHHTRKARRARRTPTQCALAASLAALHMGAVWAQAAEPAAPTAEAAALSAPNGAAAAAAAEDQAGSQLDKVVVTGSTSLRRTVRESSVAVTVADREVLDRKAPRSTAQALELVPGIMVEASGGEVSNNFSVRGLAGGAQQFIQFQEDGLPVFYTNALSDTILKQELFIDRMEAVRGGTSGILTANGAGATINFLTFKNKDDPEGAARITLSDYGTKRFDFRYGGRISENWFGGVGGFFRSSDSVRDTGFTADHGGIFRGYLGRKLDDGEFSVNMKLVDDHNTFLLPIPLRNPSRPTGLPGINANYGTLLGRDNGIMTVLTSPKTGALSQVNDAVNDGVATRSQSFGYNFEKGLDKEWRLRSKGRYTHFQNDFNSVFSFDNASLQPGVNRLDPSRNTDVQGMLNRFAGACGGACIPGLRIVGTGEVLTAPGQINALNGNGLVAENISARNKRYLTEYVNDAAVTWTLPNNSLTIGWLMFDTKINKESNVGATKFLSDVRSNARRTDIVAVGPNGQVAGALTDGSVLEYGTWGEGVNTASMMSNSLYINDEYKVNDRWRVDAGARLEHFRYNGWQGQGIGRTKVPGAFDANGNDVDNIIANNEYAGTFGGNFKHVTGNWTEPSWTVGTNYLINDNMAVYGRYAASYQANNENPVTKINFAELGLRYKQRGFSVTGTLFRTQFKDYRVSRQFGTDTRSTDIVGDIIVNGLELEANWRPVRWGGLTFTGVFQKSAFDPKSATGPSAESQARGMSAFKGNRPKRTPELNFTVAPTWYFPNRKGELSLAYHLVGDRFSDPANTLKLPAYRTFDLSMRYELTPAITLNASIQNLTNTVGLTEGNPRSGFSEVAGNSDYFFARPILGRNASVSLTMTF